MPFWVIIITRNKVLITHTQDFDLKKKVPHICDCKVYI